MVGSRGPPLTHYTLLSENRRDKAVLLTSATPVTLHNMRKPVSISLPEEMLRAIDSERGDVPRSRFIERRLKQEFEAGSSGSPTVRPPRPKEPQGSAADPGWDTARSAASPQAPPFKCPAPECDWKGAAVPTAKCPSHGRKVVPR